MQQEIGTFLQDMAALAEKNIYSQEWFQKLTIDHQDAIRRRDENTARCGAERLVEAIEARDIDVLEQRLHAANMTSRKLFTNITGVSLGKTNKSGSEGIRQFIGADVYDAHWKNQAAVAEARRASEKQAAEDAAANEVLDQLVNYKIDCGPQKAATRRQFIDDLIAAGYRPEDAKKGFATVVRMTNGRQYFKLNTKPEMQYARKQAASVAV